MGVYLRGFFVRLEIGNQLSHKPLLVVHRGRGMREGKVGGKGGRGWREGRGERGSVECYLPFPLWVDVFRVHIKV